MEVDAHALQQFAVAVEHARIRRAPVGAHLGEALQRVRGQHQAHAEHERCERVAQVHRTASTFTRAFGVSPNISGAYIASTRLGGSENSPTLFRRTVYSILITPFGTYS